MILTGSVAESKLLLIVHDFDSDMHFRHKILLVFLALCLYRSSRRRCSFRKGVLRNFVKFIGKHLCQGLFFKKKRPYSKRFLAQMFSCEFSKFLRTPFLKKHLRWLFLSTLSQNYIEYLIHSLTRGKFKCIVKIRSKESLIIKLTA